MPTPTPAQGSGRGQVSLGLRGEWFDRGEWCSAADRRLKQQCAATLVTGEPYLVTLVARAPLGTVPRYGGEAYTAVYTAAQWQASRGGGGGGGGGGGLSGGGVVVLLLLGLGFAAGGAFYGRLVYTGKRSLRHDWAAASERAAILAAATVDKAPYISTPHPTSPSSPLSPSSPSSPLSPFATAEPPSPLPPPLTPPPSQARS